ncbi:MAG: discoidin domain-containing protein [Planctomycetota bacterium]|nr:discoidin domain-containing protein [Planctomycetota bacterium]
MSVMRRLVVAAGVVLSVAGAWPCEAEAQQATASSEWGPGYGAGAAADDMAGENGNYWQTVQNKDKGAWWQLDLGREATVRTVKIAWARWEDKVHCPPANLVIQVSRTGAADAWKEVVKLGPKDLPRDGQPYDVNRTWPFALPQPATARYVRLLFPDGSQPGAKYPGYLCLGEVEVPAPEIQARILTIEGKFGQAAINVDAPAMVSLYLRGPDGLSSQSLLAHRPMGPYPYPGYSRARARLPWARHACTYAVTQDGTRYESRAQKPASVEAGRDGGHAGLRIAGIQLVSNKGPEALAVEDWTFSTPGDGAQLVWTIVRRWNQDATVMMSGSPGLFFGFDARKAGNSVTSTLWYDPDRLAVRPSEMYNLAVSLPGRIAETHIQTVLDRDAWAIYKLWTNWHAPADLRLEVRGGHLYRRGSFAFLSEAGAVTSPEAVQTCRKGQIETITLHLAAVDKRTTGYQLAITLPDKATEASLKDFYGSVLNGGAINDQKNFDFGNETDGWYYAGSSWMYGAALAAGTPAPGALASRPYDASRAFRGHLARIMNTLDDQGRSHFGYNQTGQWVDDNLHTILGAHFYLLHSGDVTFVRQHLPAMERMLDYFIKRRNAQGLFTLDGVGAHWYYDAIITGGVNGYYNAFFCKAAQDLAEMEEAVGAAKKAQEYRTLAESRKTAYNRVLWRDRLPGGPRYLDWIDAQGNEVAYFCDLCQWPPIAAGIASPEQARKIVATADARIKELETQHGYRGYASLSALWPVPKPFNPVGWQTFGTYMNGGSLLCQTYWEVVARAQAGDCAGAARRLRLFAQRARETSWAGNNSADIHGERGGMESGEAYLADMVVVTAAAIHGVLGIHPTWKSLEVTPHLPPEWDRAEAEILYKGQRHRVVIEKGKPQIHPL